MSVSIRYPDVNGHRFSWASVAVLIGPTEIVGFKSINYEHTLEPADVYGTGPQKIGRTRGRDNATGSMEMYRLEFLNLIEALGGNGYKEVPFDIIVSFADRDQPTVTDTIRGARITKSTYNQAEGTDALVVSCDLNIMQVLEGGVNGNPGVLGTSPIQALQPTGQ